MGFILQTQRRAVEEVFCEEDLELRENSEYLLGGKNLELLGVSKGVGTCSDERFHGVDIAVFCLKPQTGAANDENLQPMNVDGYPCRVKGSVLVGELAESGDSCRTMVVNGLLVESASGRRVVFMGNGKRSTYVLLI